MVQFSFHSPLGDLTLSEEGGRIVSLDWGRSPMSTETALLRAGKQMLDNYFDGLNPEFTLPLDLAGTAFQKRVWQVMTKIPYGDTMTYGEVAEAIGSHPRAVGTACGLNPVPIIIPCHRVMGKGGKLTGYSGGNGVESKKFLLDLEKTTLNGSVDN